MTDAPLSQHTDVNVADFLLCGRDPCQTALITIGREHTYGELQSAVAGVARYLRQTGAGEGHRVLLISENCFFWVAAYLGTLHAGLVSVPLPVSISRQDLEFIIQTTGARVALLHFGVAAKHADLFVDCHVLTDRAAPVLASVVSQADFAALPAGDSPIGSAKVGTDDLAALMFTSGSTGKPRGVMVTHANIVANTESIIQYLSLTRHDRIMAVLPFHYCFGTSLLHTHLRAGASLVLDSRFLYPETILQRMIETECTGFAGVPSHFQILLRTSSLGRKKFPRLRYVQQAGGCLANHFIQELRQALPTTQVFIMYGQTEATARLSCLPPELLDRKMGSIGKGIPGVRLQVLNTAGIEVHPQEIGEIVAEGRNIARGYWNDPEETAAIFRDGKLYTGDLATVDEDGFIYIVDRARDFLKCGGKRVSCREVENRLLNFRCLLEAAVVSTPDEILGEAVKVFLVSRMPDCAGFEECFLGFCKENLPQELAPKATILVDHLPKNSAGKVLKRDLEES